MNEFHFSLVYNNTACVHHTWRCLLLGGWWSPHDRCLFTPGTCGHTHMHTRSPALTVTASTNCSLQECVPITSAKLVFLMSLSTVLCQTEAQHTVTVEDGRHSTSGYRWGSLAAVGGRRRGGGGAAGWERAPRHPITHHIRNTISLVFFVVGGFRLINLF